MITAAFGIPFFESGAAMWTLEMSFHHPHDGFVSL